MSAWRSLVVLVGSCVVVSAIGCEGSGNYATVTGTVTHNGNPVDGAKVEFHATTEREDGARDIFTTLTDSSGKYMIAGLGDKPGIPPGLYKVSISKLEGEMGSQEGMDAGQMEAQMSDMAAGVGALNTVKNLLPNVYASPESSKLSATVQTGVNENVNFDLK